MSKQGVRNIKPITKLHRSDNALYNVSAYMGNFSLKLKFSKLVVMLRKYHRQSLFGSFVSRYFVICNVFHF